MKVEVQLYSQACSIKHDGVRNAYTKDGLYCILYTSGVVRKYPVQHIFRITEYQGD